MRRERYAVCRCIAFSYLQQNETRRCKSDLIVLSYQLLTTFQQKEELLDLILLLHGQNYIEVCKILINQGFLWCGK